MREKSLEMIDLELAILLRRITSSNRKLGHLDRSAYLLLHRFITRGPAGVKVLSDEFHLDISTISRQTAALEQKGYVYRIPDPTDGRAYTLHITELGKNEFYEHQQTRLSAIGENVKDWPEYDLQHFGELLRKYNHSSTNK
ncbi:MULTISPECIES: MarR family winged helix-turn-helix transcriptional regulator [Bacillaceae]|uniref:MarR family winged helix-turn-helix transcriptional regulator n=1 Tax=Bacillaceae TaxID=186817 RepID=UPI002FFE1411